MKQSALTINKVIHSEIALANMKKKFKAVIIYNLDCTVYGEYPSIIEAAKSLNCNEKTNIRALKTKSKLLKKR
jgi:hypothetical protein